MKTVRLLKAFRGYRSGESMQATDELASRLIGSGVAVAETQPGLFDTRRAERAVEVPRGRSIETR